MIWKLEILFFGSERSWGFSCLFAYSPAYPPACLRARPPACTPVYLPACLRACLPVCLRACLPVCNRHSKSTEHDGGIAQRLRYAYMCICVCVYVCVCVCVCVVTRPSLVVRREHTSRATGPDWVRVSVSVRVRVRVWSPGHRW